MTTELKIRSCKSNDFEILASHLINKTYFLN